MIQSRQARLQAKDVFISCIVPVYNEADGIQKFIQALNDCLQTYANRYELVIVDDGSRDATLSIVNQLSSKYPLRYFSFSRNFGKEAALSAGIEYAKGDVVILIDADFQHPLELIPTFLNYWADGYAMVYGVQTNRQFESRIKRYSTQLFYSFLSHITHIKIPAHAGDFRLLDRCVIDALKQIDERSRFMKGLYAWVGFRSIGVPFNTQKRTTGQSGWRFSRLAELAITGITSFSDLPLRIMALIGMVISFFSFVYAIFIILNTLIFGRDVPGFATLLVGIIFFGGVQLVCLGIVGEYIGRIFNEVKRRPHYIIAQTNDKNEKLADSSAS